MLRNFLKSAVCPGLIAAVCLLSPSLLQAQAKAVEQITGGPAPPAPQGQAAPAVKGLPTAEERSEISQELAKADKAQKEGDYIGAMDALWRAQERVWQRAPLGVRNVAFITEQPENFGTYQVKAGEDFRSPEPLIFYCEPVGFTQVKEGDTYRYSIIGAFDIINSDGQVLGGQKDLGPYEQSGYRTFSMETMLTMTIGIHGLHPGSYIMRVTLTDNLDRSKTVQVDKHFNIV